jgi:hypothetical protein
MSVVSKYYIVKVFIVQCNLSIKLRNYSFLDICLYELLFLFGCEEPTLEVCRSILDTPCIYKDLFLSVPYSKHAQRSLINAV